MKRVAQIAMAVLFCSVFLPAQNTPPSTEQKPQSPADSAAKAIGPLDVLSDTMGVDFGPYLSRVIHDVRENWHNLIPERARSGFAKGKVTIQFAIMKDGKVAEMKLTETSGDVSLDRAAYGGIVASSPFWRLPAEFGGQYLRLRFRFYYNPEKGEVPTRQSKSKITVSIFPHDSVDVHVGESEPMIATVKGAQDTAVTWGVAGTGCTGDACGTIDNNGLYVAPSTLPNPPSVTVTAYAKADLEASASVTVHLVPAPKQ